PACDHALAGLRCALNVAAIAVVDIRGGDGIAYAGELLATTRVVLGLRLHRVELLLIRFGGLGTPYHTAISPVFTWLGGET
ncbi:hypothetical protein AAGG49_22140, partial [Stenotrophomonas maltophilia]|uniref:hypothetical protein n=1 Tax=Stenotrophomonas maltophilia TaxID=40324 RepID=UPI00313E872A